MSTTTETYQIGSGQTGAAKCVCGHTRSAHGSGGMICCACECLLFDEAAEAE